MRRRPTTGNESDADGNDGRDHVVGLLPDGLSEKLGIDESQVRQSDTGVATAPDAEQALAEAPDPPDTVTE